jgi:hypothetical protein
MRFINACPSTNGARTYPEILDHDTVGQILNLFWKRSDMESLEAP